MDTIDVLFAVTTLGPGGTEGYVEDLAVALASRGARIAVMVDSDPMLRLHSFEASGIPVHRLEIEGSCSRSDYATRVGKVLSRYTVRLIHANMWIRQAWLQNIARIRNIPFIITGHHTVPPLRMRDRLGLNRVPFQLYRSRRLLSKGNAGTICISETSLANYRSRYGFKARAARVYCARPDGPARANPSCGGTSPKIVWLGTMTARKRPFLAIRAFRALLSRFPDCTLFMTGEGQLSSSVRQEAEKLEGRVTLLGHVPSIDEYLSDAAILLQTSANEGTPRAVLEAMSAGLPVVATDAGATKELVQNAVTGLLVPVDNQTAISNALAILAADPGLRSQYGKAGRQVFEERFNFQRMVDETVQAYEQLVGVTIPADREIRAGQA
jgi:glycosyltransferase involved in cell wall biosynthesis